MATDRGNARKNKQDEFYTKLIDIENECKHYKQHFKDKIIFAIAMTHLKVISSNTLQ